MSLDIVSIDDSAFSISDDLVHEGRGPGLKLKCPVFVKLHFNCDITVKESPGYGAE